MTTKLTAKQIAYIAHGEGLVREAYKDSVGVWTWALGVTDNSGHIVFPRYKDNPQSIERCIEVSEWLMREKYLPPVLSAFGSFKLNEAQLAAALSFHWNTGAIGKTQWVKDVVAGNMEAGRKFLETHYLNGTDLVGRRKSESDLFFKGIWPKNLGSVLIYEVRKPSYNPGKAAMVDIMPAIKKAIGEG